MLDRISDCEFCAYEKFIDSGYCPEACEDVVKIHENHRQCPYIKEVDND
jgi:hypothetical protein